MVSRGRKYRRRTGVLMYDLAQWLGFSPALISAMEVGRPVQSVPRFFLPDTSHRIKPTAVDPDRIDALRMALMATEPSGSQKGGE